VTQNTVHTDPMAPHIATRTTIFQSTNTGTWFIEPQ